MGLGSKTASDRIGEAHMRKREAARIELGSPGDCDRAIWEDSVGQTIGTLEQFVG